MNFCCLVHKVVYTLDASSNQISISLPGATKVIL